MTCPACGKEFLDGAHRYDPVGAFGMPLLVCPNAVPDLLLYVNPAYLKYGRA